MMPKQVALVKWGNDRIYVKAIALLYIFLEILRGEDVILSLGRRC